MFLGFPDSSDSKESACNVGEPGSIPGSGRSPGEGNSSPLQYSRLENYMNRGAWRATVHGVTENQTQLRTTTLTFIHICKQVHTASEKIPKLEFCLDAGHTEIWSGLKSKIAGS